MEAFTAANDLLRSRFRIDLEEALCDGCLMGRINVRLADIARIIPRRVYFSAAEDGGEASGYEGIFVLEGVWYRFRCQVFVDAGGMRFLSDIQQFEAVQWQVHLPMPKAGPMSKAG